MDRTRLRRIVATGARPAVLAGAILISGVVIGWNMSGSTVRAAAGTPVAAAAARVPDDQPGRAAGLRGQDSYADLVGQVAPAVVTIRSERVVRQVASPFGDDQLLEQFFGRQGRRMQPQPREEGALGSGVIVSPDGYILTNAHVVDGATQIRVELTDRRTFVAKVVGSDQPSDLAVLKIE